MGLHLFCNGGPIRIYLERDGLTLILQGVPLGSIWISMDSHVLCKGHPLGVTWISNDLDRQFRRQSVGRVMLD